MYQKKFNLHKITSVQCLKQNWKESFKQLILVQNLLGIHTHNATILIAKTCLKYDNNHIS